MSDNVIIPALQGYHQIRFIAPAVGKVSPQGIKEAAKIFPIIGWAISGESRTPITPHDAPAAENEIRVTMLPSGVIIDADGVQHRGFDQWTTFISEQWRAKQPPARGPAYALAPVPNVAPPQPAQSRSGWSA